MFISGKEVWPIIEGGKGIGATNGITAGNFAKAGAVGTFSGAMARSVDEFGNIKEEIFKGKTRLERHKESIDFSIKGGIDQARIATDIDSAGNGRIHMNVLWEMGSCAEILQGILEGTKNGVKNLIHGVTSGAGMPYKLAEIASKFKVYYYPIVSSSRAFAILWKRAYKNFSEFLGGVVYEDPWLAGGHNGLSNAEDPNKPLDPKERVIDLRKSMNEFGLHRTPIVMAGGVWNLNEWKDYIDDPRIAPVAFQFGTRPLVTKETPIKEHWIKKIFTLKEGDIFLNKFSPTGFYSSAVRNKFLQRLIDRSERQVSYSDEKTDNFDYRFVYNKNLDRAIYVRLNDQERIEKWVSDGFTEIMKTPDNTVIFVSPSEKKQIVTDQINCVGCLSHCRFSNWKDHNDHTTGIKPDPRSFCIQKTLKSAVYGDDIENDLMFSGHNGFRFVKDPWYQGGKFIPTIKELVDRILTGF
jgi:nitronate monooxygenase